MEHKQIKANESGGSVRAKLNEMLAALISGPEGANETLLRLYQLQGEINSLISQLEAIQTAFNFLQGQVNNLRGSKLNVTDIVELTKSDIDVIWGGSEPLDPETTVGEELTNLRSLVDQITSGTIEVSTTASLVSTTPIEGSTSVNVQQSLAELFRRLIIVETDLNSRTFS